MRSWRVELERAQGKAGEQGWRAGLESAHGEVEDGWTEAASSCVRPS